MTCLRRLQECQVQSVWPMPSRSKRFLLGFYSLLWALIR
jgi:hypothetical protein